MNELKLHEAIVVVLSEKESRTATTEEIAKEINKRKLYFKRDGSPVEKGQIRLRTHTNTKAGKFYSYLFEFIEPDMVRLRNV